MKTVLAISLLITAAFSQCPDIVPPECTDDTMPCPGGVDSVTGCPVVDSCYPRKGIIRKNQKEMQILVGFHLQNLDVLENACFAGIFSILRRCWVPPSNPGSTSGVDPRSQIPRQFKRKKICDEH